MEQADKFIKDKEFQLKKLWADWSSKERTLALQEYADQQLLLHAVIKSVCDCEVKGAYEEWTVHICKKCDKEQI